MAALNVWANSMSWATFPGAPVAPQKRRVARVFTASNQVRTTANGTITFTIPGVGTVHYLCFSHPIDGASPLPNNTFGLVTLQLATTGTEIFRGHFTQGKHLEVYVELDTPESLIAIWGALSGTRLDTVHGTDPGDWAAPVLVSELVNVQGTVAASNLLNPHPVSGTVAVSNLDNPHHVVADNLLNPHPTTAQVTFPSEMDVNVLGQPIAVQGSVTAQITGGSVQVAANPPLDVAVRRHS